MEAGKCEMASDTSPVSQPEINQDKTEDKLPSLIKDKVSNGKLSTKVRCERCSSLVLSPGMAKYVSKKVNGLRYIFLSNWEIDSVEYCFQ